MTQTKKNKLRNKMQTNAIITIILEKLHFFPVYSDYKIAIIKFMILKLYVSIRDVISRRYFIVK